MAYNVSVTKCQSYLTYHHKTKTITNHTITKRIITEQFCALKQIVSKGTITSKFLSCHLTLDMVSQTGQNSTNEWIVHLAIDWWTSILSD
jgi:hypothetical protein